VVAVADRAEFDGRNSRREEGDRVRGAIATHAHHPLRVVGGRRLAETLYERRVGLHDRGRSPEGGEHLGIGQAADLPEDLVWILVWQEADIDVYDAGIGHFVQGIAAHDPTEIDGGAVEQGGAVACKR
jgi:hypothetical protein